MSDISSENSRWERPPKRDWFGPGLVTPALLVLLGVGLLPFLYSVMVSFQRLTLLDQYTSFQGFVNYARIFDDARLWRSLLNTFIIMAVALPLQLVFGLSMAHHFLEDRPGKKFFVAILILPAMVSPIVAGSMWRLMYDDRFGPINQILSLPFEKHWTILWTIQPVLAFAAVIICEVWEWTPFMFIILLAALSNVDRDQIDAAAIDGASRWKTFRYVSLPAIWPVMAVALIIRALDLFRTFDVVWQITKGGPGNATETISIYMFIRGFQEFETSYVAAQVVLVLISLSAILFFLLRRMRLS